MLNTKEINRARHRRIQVPTALFATYASWIFKEEIKKDGQTEFIYNTARHGTIHFVIELQAKQTNWKQDIYIRTEWESECVVCMRTIRIKREWINLSKKKNEKKKIIIIIQVSEDNKKAHQNRTWKRRDCRLKLLRARGRFVVAPSTISIKRQYRRAKI